MSNDYTTPLTDAQREVVLKFRTETQLKFTALLKELGESGLENPSLTVLSEMAALTVLSEMSALIGDIIYLVQKHSTPETLEINKCASSLELADLLCILAANTTVLTVRDYNVQAIAQSVANGVSDGSLDAVMAIAKNAVKH